MKYTGVISEVFPKMANVILDEDTSRKILCTYRRGQIVDRDAEWRERSPVSPGDRVQIHAYGTKDGVIEEIFPRVNSIARRAPGREGKLLHTIAANVDFVVIVSAIRSPDFSPGFIDRFLIAAQAAEIAPVIVVNKMDLRIGDEKPWALYESMGMRCYPVSTANKEGIEPLRECLKGKVSVFCGHSGVGKTTLLTELFGSVVGKTNEISKSSGKGKHTTTVSKLLIAENGTRFIDTPGIKEFGLLKVDPKDLIQFFPELWELQKEHKDYNHLPRYATYMKIKAALEDEGR